MPHLSLFGSTYASTLLSRVRGVVAMIVLVLAAAVLGSTAQAQTMSVGNCVFFDSNANGHFDTGEGVGGVSIELWHATGDNENPYELTSVLQTQPSGYYLFQGLTPGTYYVRIPETQFAPGQPLAGAWSLPGAQLTGDDDTGEDGQDTFDASVTGINSIEFTVSAGFGPTSATGETGFLSSTDDAEDTNVDLTVDFGFYQPVGLGNLIFADMNGNGHADPGEGISGVVVQLFNAADDPATDPPLSDIVTSTEGTFMFGGLAAGSYKLHVPASQFAAGGPLEGAISVPGTGATGDDDDAANGDDGIDAATPAISGITSAAVTLSPGSAPTAATTETGFASGDDDGADADYDLTVDFGFVFPPNKVAVGNLVFIDYDNSGHYDDGEGVAGVTLQLFLAGQDPQTDTPIATRVSKSDGSYLFANLDPGSYRIHISKVEFAPGKPLFSALSIVANAAGDDGDGEDGIDAPYPEDSGISSGIFTLSVGGAPTSGTIETGYAADSDNFRDADVDLTYDFGFTLRANTPLSVGNLVFNDTNHDGGFSVGESGIGNVLLQLFHEGDNPLLAAPVAALHSEPSGAYMFSGLTPGRYFVFVPPSEFGAGKPLFGLLSSPGNGGDDGADDDHDENGIDSATPQTTGIATIVFELSDNLEAAETGFSPDMDSADDNNGDLTIDLGFAIDCPVISISPLSIPGATRDQAYSATFNLTGATGTITWTIASGSLPAGLTLSAGGALTGSPAQTGGFSFTVQAETEEHCIANHSYTLWDPLESTCRHASLSIL